MFDFLCEVKCRVAYLSYPPLTNATYLTRQQNALYSALFSVRLSHSNFCIFSGANSESIRITLIMILPFSVILFFLFLYSNVLSWRQHLQELWH